jgi:3-dehydrosphinganine reductase
MFKNKTILITGGSSGLGLGLAQALLEKGARLILLARTPEKLEQAKERLLKSIPGGNVDIIPVDVSDREALQEALHDALQRQPSLDMVINNAGILREGYFEKLAVTDFKEMFGANYFGALYITQITLPYLKKSRGRLINVASVAGLTGGFGLSAYGSSKYALIGLTETLRCELKPQGVTVQVVCPPEFLSPMVEELDTYRTPENLAHTIMIPRLSLDTLVKETIKGIEKNKFKIIPGWRTRLMLLGAQHFPGISRFFADQVIKKAYAGPDQHNR